MGVPSITVLVENQGNRCEIPLSPIHGFGETMPERQSRARYTGIAKAMHVNRRACLATASAALVPGARAATDPSREWRFYGGDSPASRYSACEQINLKTVAKLKPAWVHHPDDSMQRPATTDEFTPFVAGG